MSPSPSSTVIRPAQENDLRAILGLVNYHILETTAMYDYDPKTLDDLESWMDEKQRSGLPLIVAESGGTICGYGTYGPFRAKIGYRFSAEHSVYVERDHHGKGIGRMLVESLIARACEEGYHTLIAGIDAMNGGSIAFHEKMGFTEVARFREVGYKFGRWLDLVFMQLMLAENHKGASNI